MFKVNQNLSRPNYPFLGGFQASFGQAQIISGPVFLSFDVYSFDGLEFFCTARQASGFFYSLSLEKPLYSARC